MEIKLTPEELAIAQEAIRSRAEAKGISQEQAAKDLLAMGINSWLEMESMRKREEAWREKNFNPFAAARGEYKQHATTTEGKEEEGHEDEIQG